MGTASGGFGFEAQLTADQRARLIRKVSALPETVRGKDVARLADLVEIAVVSASPAGLAAEIEAVHKAAGPHITGLMKAAKALSAVMPPDESDADFATAADERPWLHRIDHFEGVIADIFEGGPNDRDASIKAAVAVRQLVAALGPLKAPRLRGRKPYMGTCEAVIAAVCFYHGEEGLDLTYWWGEPQLRAGDKDRGRQAEAPIPGTATAQLIAAVADALELPESNFTLRDRLDRYGRRLKKQKRGPALADFSVEHAVAADGLTG